MRTVIRERISEGDILLETELEIKEMNNKQNFAGKKGGKVMVYDRIAPTRRKLKILAL